MRSFEIPAHYQSGWMSKLKNQRKLEDPKKQDFSAMEIHFDGISFFLPRHFGFCFGVENAVEMIYKCLAENQGKKIYLLSEMIHNPLVNEDLASMGVAFIQDTSGNLLTPWENLKNGDIVVIPAFGAPLETEEKLQKLGIVIKKYDTTCPFVERVWNRGEKLAQMGCTLIIHGKHYHEETKATFSRAQSFGKAIVVRDQKEAELLAEYILGNKKEEDFWIDFAGKISKNFDFQKDLQKVAIINQTTMLADETQAIALFFKEIMQKKYGETELQNHFVDSRDTLCYATNDNQMAAKAMLNEDLDCVFVIGGINSSNTNHLAQLFEQKFPTFFIERETDIENREIFWYYDLKTHKRIKNQHFFNNLTLQKTKKNYKIGITAGASCPDSLVEAVISRIKNII